MARLFADYTLMPKEKKNKRIISVDILRGIAVFLMVLAHSIAFLSKEETFLLAFLRNTGDILCFTIFLFVSGISSYLAYLSIADKEWSVKKKKLLKRNIVLLLGYYLVALVASLKSFSLSISGENLEEFLRILLLINVPSYTEFLIPFIFYGFLIYFFRNYLKKLSGFAILLISVSVITFALGIVLYSVNLPEPLVYYKALFAGQENLYRFPIMQYFPVLLIGFSMGRSLLGLDKNKERYKVYAKYLALLILLLFSSFIINSSGHYLLGFNRWPPSVLFISLGLSVAVSLLIIIEILKEISMTNSVLKPLILLGKMALGIFVVHDIILHINDLLFGFKSDNSLIVIIAFLIVLIFSLGLVNLNRMRLNAKS